MGDYLFRPNSSQGVTTAAANSSVGIEWTIESVPGNFMVKSWKGDYLHRPESGWLTTWGTGIGGHASAL